MLTLLNRNQLARTALLVALLLSICSACLFVSGRPAQAAPVQSTVALTDPGDNYPAKWRDPVPQDSVADDWGEFNRECTSWASFALSDRNKYQIPFHDFASNWGAKATALGKPPNNTPALGSIAWWAAYAPGASQWGHVAWVSNVDSSGGITVEQYNADFTGHYSTAYFAKGSSTWPTGFIHFKDILSAPVSISRNANTMTVFYNDGNNHLKAWYWDVNVHPSWWSQSWDDNIVGQPAAIARDDGDMDVFYRTADGRLRHIGWNVNIGWATPETLVTSDDVGDPAVAARDSGHMAVFYRTSEGEIKYVSWDSSQIPGWNLNPQRIYTSGATGDPAAISRSPSTYDVFFVKNNGNLVHLGWDSCCGWITEDWTANMTGRPSAITRDSGGHMSVFYRESNGNIAERFWDVSSGWGVQDWPAQLTGNPNAVVLDDGDVEVYYRETGGNIADRYWSIVNGWGATWITGTGTSTSDPWGIRRGTTSPNLEVHYWNGNNLQDTNWSFGYPWTTSTVTSTP